MPWVKDQEVAQLMTGKASVYYSTIGWMQPAGRLATSHRMILCSAIPFVVNFPNFSWNGLALQSKQDSSHLPM